MADPLCRWRNATPQTVCELVHELPKEKMTSQEFRKIMEKSKFGIDFFHTPYQLACQLGLYVETDYYTPRFEHDINEEEAKEYLIHWFSKYYVPNPYTKRGFKDIEKPVLVEYSFYEYLKKCKDNSIESACLEIFKEPIGNPDIFINAINNYSRLIKIEHNKCYIREGAEKMEVDNPRDDKQAFFDYLDNSSSKIKKPHNRIIFGAPGTGKSHQFNEESKAFEAQQTDKSMIIQKQLEKCTNHGDYIKFGMLHSEDIKGLTGYQINDKYKTIYGYYIRKGASVTPNPPEKTEEEKIPDNELEIMKNPPHGDGEYIGLKLGYKYHNSFIGKTRDQLIEEYKAAPVIADWIPRGVNAAESTIEDVKDNQSSSYVERVTFHPSYTFSQFVGTYKPVKSKANIEDITYEYIPGPFMRVYVNAKNNPEKNFLLLIEEINRANVAAVFGDVFQLLDRDECKKSKYTINASEDQKEYLKSKGIFEEKIAIPENMYIWATMNSADQGVMPMDAAFKRRWDFEYLDIDANENAVEDYDIPIKDGSEFVNWNKFRKALNNILSEKGVNEDKLLGPFFINKETLENAKNNKEEFIKLFKSKVIMYLFEDVLKMQRNNFFKINRYSLLCKEFDVNGMEIFGLNNDDLKTENSQKKADETTEQA